MTQGPMEAVTGGIGVELDLADGARSTRLTATTVPETQITFALDTAGSVDLGVTITLTAGTFPVGVLVGQRFRLLSGAGYGLSGIIATINGPRTQITLLAAGLGINFAAQSWEVVREPDTTIAVESTFGWANTGELFIDAVRYRYTSRTLTTLAGLSNWDGTQWVSGVAQVHAIEAEVLDYTRNYSALDFIRRQLLLDYAEGEYLNLLGASLGVPRPEVLTDEEQYREFVRALAFSPRGTVFALELVLDALLGDGNWEVFEDFTGFVEQHFATIFIRRTDLDPTDPAGKFFLDGEDRRPITTTTTIALTETPLEVAGVRLADDPTDVRLVAQGLLASSVDGLAITGPAGAFPARVRRGQRFEVLGGPQAGAWGRVLSRTSDTAITLGISAGVSGAGLGAAIRNVPWRIVADYSQFRWNLPSVDTVLEYVGDTGTTLWEWFGASTTEGASVSNATDAALGYYLSIGDPSAGATTAYRHRARIQPESFAAFQLLCAVPGSLGTGSTDGLQVTLQIRDSVRRLAIGWIGDVGGTFARIGFINATTGAFLNATITLYQWTYASPGFRTVEIRKYGRGGVVLLVDGQIVDRAAYASFATGTETELIFGCLSTTQSPVLQVKAADWKISTERDYWNARASAGTMPGGGSRNIAALGGIVQVGDVGRRMRIFSIAALNAGGGNARGEWLIEARVDANTATLIGPTRRGATFRRGYPNYVFIRGDDFALNWPDAKGHQFEILTGPNAGVHTIVNLRDPETLADFDLLPNGSQKAMVTGAAGLLAAGNEISENHSTYVVELNNSTAFEGDDDEATWRIVPVFPTDVGPIVAEIVDASSHAGVNLTLRQALPLGISGGWTPLVSVEYTRVLSGQIQDETDRLANDDFWPAFLFDAFGLLRQVIEEITAAGVWADFDSLFVDDAGMHVIEE